MFATLPGAILESVFECLALMLSPKDGPEEQNVGPELELGFDNPTIWDESWVCLTLSLGEIYKNQSWEISPKTESLDPGYRFGTIRKKHGGHSLSDNAVRELTWSLFSPPSQ